MSALTIEERVKEHMLRDSMLGSPFYTLDQLYTMLETACDERDRYKAQRDELILALKECHDIADEADGFSDSELVNCYISKILLACAEALDKIEEQDRA